MRPFVLDELFRSVATLSGVGPKTGKLIEKLTGGGKILDLLFHKPIELVERIAAPSIMQAPLEKTVLLTVTVDRHTPSPRRSQPYRIRGRDESGFLDLVFFNAHAAYLEKQYPPNQQVIIAGKLEDYRGGRQIVHPDLLGTPEQTAEIEKVDIIYPLTAGLTNRVLRKTVHAALEKTPSLPDWLDPAYARKMQWTPWQSCIHDLHHPRAAADLTPASPVRQRLAYDELLSNQLALALMRNRQRKLNGRSLTVGGKCRKLLEQSLPYTLTTAQQSALTEIDRDMNSPTRMLRLLQGDVGSGKTVVAALAMMNAIDSGTQAAIMAPTEILARQHAATFQTLLKDTGLEVLVLTGRDKGKVRDAHLQAIASGTARIIIGTHALFQDSVEFHDLGLAVIDEQHRFGVHQRLQLSAKGRGTDILVMTATPIPRTLALTAYGDMEVSRIMEKPPGRQPVDTRLIANDRLDEMVAGLQRQLEQGVRAYWVCPLVEESEILDLAAAEQRYEILQSHFGNRVGLIHGRMKPAEKDAVMEKFISGTLSILVATTVIEVGVDVPQATIMIVEHAERFGLAQLHQLRGRVGRGQGQSYCFLIYSAPLGETARERLQIMRQTEDGFLIAEKDLELRGSGEILGTRQSGLPEFRLADLSTHAGLLLTARDDARLIIERDPDLKSSRGEALRVLLYLFEQDQAISYLRSG